MPHVNDKRLLDQAAHALGGPRNRHKQAAFSGRPSIDTPSAGQQDFQALLFRILNTPAGTHPWDMSMGREFPDLWSYISWVLPEPDRLVINTNMATLVAAYLVPSVRECPDGSFEMSGIAGLRTTGFDKHTITLTHLPTQGTLALEDSSKPAWSRTSDNIGTEFTQEIRRHRGKGELSSGRRALYREPDLTTAERMALRERIEPSSLLSALLVRSKLWTHNRDGLPRIRTARRSSTVAAIQWSAGFTADEIGRILTQSAIAIPAARYEPSMSETTPATCGKATKPLSS